MFTITTECGLKLAVTTEFERPLVAPLTACCGASGKGSANVGTGVCCRACYREVPATYGGCLMLGDDGETLTLTGWITDLTWPVCPTPGTCATHTLWQITEQIASRGRHPAGKGRLEAERQAETLARVTGAREATVRHERRRADGGLTVESEGTWTR